MKSTHHPPHRRRQRGQTFLWFLATIAACCSVFALVYNVGQVANHKEATINAADATALSGALVEARMLNFEAYINRAMVANEVTIAQLVSLDSWLNYDNELLQYIATYTQPIPYLDDVTQAIAQASQAAISYVNPIIAAAVQPLEDVNSVLRGFREYANITGAIAANDIAGKIARANATAPVGTFTPIVEGVNAIQWYSFTAIYSNDDRAIPRDVILNSRDPFSTKRGAGKLIDLLNTGLRILGLNTTYINFDKTSGTTTLQDYKDWAAQDSLDATFTFNPCVLFDCSITNFIPVPIGYGRADADSDASTGDDLCNVSPSTTNCGLAVQNSNNINWSGMPDFRDLAKDLSKTDPCTTNNGSDSPSLTYIAAVQMPGNTTLTTQNIGMDTVDVPGPQGSPKMTDNLQNGGNLTSISAACTFFLRPDLNQESKAKAITGTALARADGVHEYASLFNPYWQARLTTPDPGWTATLYTLIGRFGLNVVTP
jgi:hypothetical protein